MQALEAKVHAPLTASKIQDLGAALATCASIDQVCELIIAAATEATGAQSTLVLRYEKSNGHLKPMASGDPRADLIGLDLAAGALRHSAPAQGLVGPLELSAVAMPLITEQGPLGVLLCLDHPGRAWNENDTLLLTLLSHQLALALQTLALRQRLTDKELVNKAKRLLMRMRGMDEASAHRYLQKESMNRRRPIIQLAKEILRTLKA